MVTLVSDIDQTGNTNTGAGEHKEHLDSIMSALYMSDPGKPELDMNNIKKSIEYFQARGVHALNVVYARNRQIGDNNTMVIQNIDIQTYIGIFHSLDLFLLTLSENFPSLLKRFCSEIMLMFAKN